MITYYLSLYIAILVSHELCTLQTSTTMHWPSRHISSLLYAALPTHYIYLYTQRSVSVEDIIIYMNTCSSTFSKFLLYIPDHLNHMATQTYIEKLKKLAPIVGLTVREKVLPTWRRTREVFPTPMCIIINIYHTGRLWSFL